MENTFLSSYTLSGTSFPSLTVVHELCFTGQRFVTKSLPISIAFCCFSIFFQVFLYHLLGSVRTILSIKHMNETEPKQKEGARDDER